MKTIVVINRHVIAANKKIIAEEADWVDKIQPPISVRRGRNGKPHYVYEYDIENGVLVYDPHNPLKCGATVWIECT